MAGLSALHLAHGYGANQLIPLLLIDVKAADVSPDAC